jgi:hypothetical protein
MALNDISTTHHITLAVYLLINCLPRLLSRSLSAMLKLFLPRRTSNPFVSIRLNFQRNYGSRVRNLPPAPDRGSRGDAMWEPLR